MLSGCRTWLSKGELEKLCVVLVSERGLPLETLTLEPGWTTSFFDLNDLEIDRPLPFLQLEESFRAGMVALVATSVSNVADQTDRLKPHTFRILVQTVEDKGNRETVINDDNVSRSWVPADSFWYNDQTKEKEILPVRAIQSAATPVRLLVYIEKHLPASRTEASE
uniref:Uncharacterized protein n=1 Tax=Hyaloperonospora arabidopsidis (strain Emoy2) TaxID=559515 RepID=M4C2Y7_HYAAE